MCKRSFNSTGRLTTHPRKSYNNFLTILFCKKSWEKNLQKSRKKTENYGEKAFLEILTIICENFDHFIHRRADKVRVMTHFPFSKKNYFQSKNFRQNILNFSTIFSFNCFIFSVLFLFFSEIIFSDESRNFGK